VAGSCIEKLTRKDFDSKPKRRDVTLRLDEVALVWRALSDPLRCKADPVTVFRAQKAPFQANGLVNVRAHRHARITLLPTAHRRVAPKSAPRPWRRRTGLLEGPAYAFTARRKVGKLSDKRGDHRSSGTCHRSSGRVLLHLKSGGILCMPTCLMRGMGLQVRSRFVKRVIEIKVEMMCLEVHDEEHRGHRCRKFAKGVVEVLGLEGNALPKASVVNLGG
jgi:hypothetical protein